MKKLWALIKKRKRSAILIAATAVVLLISGVWYAIAATGIFGNYELTNDNELQIQVEHSPSVGEDLRGKSGYSIEDSWHLFFEEDVKELGLIEGPGVDDCLANWNKSVFTNYGNYVHMELPYEDEPLDNGNYLSTYVIDKGTLVDIVAEHYAGTDRLKLKEGITVYFAPIVTCRIYSMSNGDTPADEDKVYSYYEFEKWAWKDNSFYEFHWPSETLDVVAGFYNKSVFLPFAYADFSVRFIDIDTGEEVSGCSFPAADGYQGFVLYGETMEFSSGLQGEPGERYEYAGYYWNNNKKGIVNSKTPASQQLTREFLESGDLVLTFAFKWVEPTPTPTPTNTPTPTPTPVPDKYYVSVVVNPEDTGDVTGGGSYETGDTVTMEQTPRGGYLFDSWSLSTGGTITDGTFIMPAQDVTVTANYKLIPHVCVFDIIKWDESHHWYECECGAASEKHLHQMVAGTPDATGQTEYTCECTEHEDCEYSYTAHKHDWIGWCAEKIWDETFYPELYHWKICSYDNCHETKDKGEHEPGDYVDEGNGWFVQHCTVCNWELDRKAVTVDLTIHPNGGQFPDGSTDPVTFKDIAYNSTTTLGKLSSDYFPEKEGKNFGGYYILTLTEEEKMYSADYDTMTAVALPKFFQDNGDGTYTSLLIENYTVYAHWISASYTVKYHSNGAEGIVIEGTMIPSYHDVGKSKALNQNGYYYTSNISYNNGGTNSVIETNLGNTNVSARFLGWAASPDGLPAYADGQVVLDLLKHGGTVNLYAVWDYGSVILPNASATDGGYKLAGWKTEDGTIISVLDEFGNYKEVEYPVCGPETLTAVWVPNTYTVTFDSTGGTGCAPIKVTYLKKYSYGNSGLPATTREGYQFLYWKSEVTGEKVTNDSIVTIAADHALTAVWKANSFPVRLDYNFNYEEPAVNPQKNSTLTSVDAETDSMECYYGDYYGELPVPSMEGYQFVSWYLEEDDAGRGCGHDSCLVSSYTRVTTNKAHTLYARWIKDTYKVTLDPNQDYTIWNPDNN